MTLNTYEFGWTDDITNEKIDIKNLARITTVHKGFCRAISEEGDLNIYLSGKFFADEGLKLATGDFLKISPRFIDEQNKSAAVVEEILPRRSKLSRVAAGKDVKEQVLVANIDYVFIVTSLNEDFNLNRLQRYVILAKEGGVTPVVILSKIDLVEDATEYALEVKRCLSQIDVLLVSSLEESGFESLLKYFKPGVTGAFVGSSGVGKSTMVNYLMKEAVQKTVEIRGDDGKGRHATTGRELFFLPQGGMIVDTAGLREVQIFAGGESLATAFKGISELMSECKFSDCTHESEPGCAIRKALDSGDLMRSDYENYLKLQREAKFNENKMSKEKSSNSKTRWKEINKNYKARKKFESRD
ncbi:MAG: ribosome small subunit-dependent GTPase A [Bdellovibrionales bacterium]